VPDVRIIILSSVAHKATPGFDIMTSTPALLACNTWLRYAASKAANILFAAELARRYPEIMSVSVHPGAVASDLYETAKASNAMQRCVITAFSSLAMRSVRTGVFNQLWTASVQREFLINGGYYTPVGNVQKYNRFATDAELGKKLWEWTDDAVKEAFKL
jgi:Dehydrogenases with different specificities (related to short-chain alcohol dehydrogenases)